MSLPLQKLREFSAILLTIIFLPAALIAIIIVIAMLLLVALVAVIQASYRELCS